MVNNTYQIRQFLEEHLTEESHNKEFYKFEAMVRKKDNPDNIFVKHHKGSFLVHSWLISSVEQYDKYIEEMIELCNLTGARLYMTLDKKSTQSMVLQLFDYANSLILNMLRNCDVSMKNVFKIMSSITSKRELNVHQDKQLLFDIDVDSNQLMSDLVQELDKLDTVSKITILKSPNGWHVTTNKFDLCLIHKFLNNNEDIDVKENALTIVYFGGNNE